MWGYNGRVEGAFLRLGTAVESQTAARSGVKAATGLIDARPAIHFA